MCVRCVLERGARSSVLPTTRIKDATSKSEEARGRPGLARVHVIWAVIYRPSGCVCATNRVTNFRLHRMYTTHDSSCNSTSRNAGLYKLRVATKYRKLISAALTANCVVAGWPDTVPETDVFHIDRKANTAKVMEQIREQLGINSTPNNLRKQEECCSCFLFSSLPQLTHP